MNKFLLAVILCFLSPASLLAQETHDFRGDARTFPFPQVRALPGRCEFGQIVQLTTDGRIFQCGASGNSWSPLGIVKPATVATLPSAATSSGFVFLIQDAQDSSDCTVGGGTSAALCVPQAGVWAALGGGGTPVVLPGTPGQIPITVDTTHLSSPAISTNLWDGLVTVGTGPHGANTRLTVNPCAYFAFGSVFWGGAYADCESPGYIDLTPGMASGSVEITFSPTATNGIQAIGNDAGLNANLTCTNCDLVVIAAANALTIDITRWVSTDGAKWDATAAGEDFRAFLQGGGLAIGHGTPVTDGVDGFYGGFLRLNDSATAQWSVASDGTTVTVTPSVVLPGNSGKTLMESPAGSFADADATSLGSSVYCPDAGSNDTYACSLTPAITVYTTGTTYYFKANTANTGAATINFNALGAKTIVKVAGGVTTALADNDIRVGQVVSVTYDGTNMQMQSLLGNGPTTLPSTSNLFSGNGSGGASNSGIAPSTVVLGAANLTSTGATPYQNGTASTLGQDAHTLNALGFGAKGDWRQSATASMTSGQATLTCTGCAFTSADVTKTVVVYNAISGGTSLSTTILTFTNSTTVTLTAGATATVGPTETVEIGTDDTTALQACLTASAGGTCYVPAGATGTYLVSAPLIPVSNSVFAGIHGVTTLRWKAKQASIAANCQTATANVTSGLITLTSVTQVTIRDLIINSNYPGNAGDNGASSTYYTTNMAICGSDHITVIGNQFQQANGSGVNPYVGDSIILTANQSSTNSSFVSISNNTFIGSATLGGTAGVQSIVGADQTDLFDNVFIAAASYFSEGNYDRIYGNRFYGDGTYPSAAIGLGSGIQYSLINNNWIFNVGASGIGNNGGCTSCTIDGNKVYAPVSGSIGIGGSFANSSITNNNINCGLGASYGIQLTNPTGIANSRVVTGNNLSFCKTGILDTSGVGDAISGNTIKANRSPATSAIALASVTSSVIGPNTLYCDAAPTACVTLDSSSTDNQLRGNNLAASFGTTAAPCVACFTVTDSGKRNTINDVGFNAGDPDSAGDWANGYKFPGLKIYDTGSSALYSYFNLGKRTAGVYLTGVASPLVGLAAGTPTAGGSCTTGTHSYKFTDVNGTGETLPSPVSSTITCGANATVPLTAISVGPGDTTSRKVYRTIAGNTGNWLLLTTIADNTTTTFSDTVADGSLGAAAPSASTAWPTGTPITGITYSTTTNCSNAASPAVCGSAAAGAVAIPTGVTSVVLVVNTTAITANSRITLTSDDSLTIAATTCNSTLATLVGGLAVTARTAGTSFTITYNGTIATNPLCVSYSIIN